MITIAAVNLQSGVATTRGYWHFPLTAWKYWMPHSDEPIEACGKLFKKEEIDIACVSEISDKSFATGGRSQPESLAKEAGIGSHHFFSSKIPFAKIRDEGNAILSRYPLSNFASHPLHKELFNCSLDEATVEIEGKNVTVFAVHLALSKKHRAIQIKEIINLVKGRSGPIILAGDMNEPNPSNFDQLRGETPLKQMCTLKTFPSWKPIKSLDYIFLSEEFKVIESYIPQGPIFSDHAAFVVRAEF